MGVGAGEAEEAMAFPSFGATIGNLTIIKIGISE